MSISKITVTNRHIVFRLKTENVTNISINTIKNANNLNIQKRYKLFEKIYPFTIISNQLIQIYYYLYV